MDELTLLRGLRGALIGRHQKNEELVHRNHGMLHATGHRTRAMLAGGRLRIAMFGCPNFKVRTAGQNRLWQQQHLAQEQQE